MKNRSRVGSLLIAIVLLLVAGVVVYGLLSGLGSDDEQGELASQPQESRNILLLGLDARDGGSGRTDTIMVANVDPNTGKISLLSIPRDTRVLLKGSYERINAAYVYGGVELIQETVEELLDIEIDNYAIIQFQGFVEVVDLFGGVKVNVPERMYHPNENIDLQPGVQILDGYDALGFARYRYTENGDLDRAQHQQEILEALRKKVFSLGTVTKIPELIAIAYEYIETDLTDAELMTLADFSTKFSEQEIASFTLPGEIVKIDGLWFYEADMEQMDSVTLPFQKDAA